MSTITFDTHVFIKRLKDAGISEPQAEAMSDAFKEAQQGSIGELSTKQDIKEIKHEMKELELRLESKIALLQWMVGIMLAGVISLILKAFFIYG
ncbi:MAG: DUF1640 domain-containing protein [Nitrospirae bacterium]|nr:DUF1640 domain-containing protein [Nitrospirota bacterium]